MAWDSIKRHQSDPPGPRLGIRAAQLFNENAKERGGGTLVTDVSEANCGLKYTGMLCLHT